MSNYLVTGARNNTPHITSMDDASLNAGIIGDGAYILNRGEKLRAEMTTSNNCRIYDGDLVTQGRHIRIETSDVVDLTINNGSAGLKRNDLVVARFTNDVETGVESVEFVVIEGTPSASPTDPEYNEGNIFDGDLIVDFPLYRIQIDGISVADPVLLLPEAPAIADVSDYIIEQGTSGMWTYRKWASGIAECWGYKTVNCTIETQYGTAIDVYTVGINADLPNDLFVSVNSATCGGGKYATGASFAVVTEWTTERILIRLIDFYRRTEAQDVNINYSVKGRWK